VYVYFRFRPTSWLSQWMSRRPTFFWCDPSTLPCSKTIIQHFTATRYYYFRYCPSSGKCTNTVVYTPAQSPYHFQSLTFKNITSLKFISLLYRRTMVIVAKPVTWTLDPNRRRKTGSRYYTQLRRQAQRVCYDVTQKIRRHKKLSHSIAY